MFEMNSILRPANCIGGVIVSVLASSGVYGGFIGGVIVSVLASSEVYRGFIGGVIVSVLASSEVDRGLIGGVIVSVLASSGVDRGFEFRSNQIKDYKIGICCFSAKHAVLRRKNKDWLARNRDNMSGMGDMSIRGL